jgi:hypothetical protein
MSYRGCAMIARKRSSRETNAAGLLDPGANVLLKTSRIPKQLLTRVALWASSRPPMLNLHELFSRRASVWPISRLESRSRQRKPR